MVGRGNPSNQGSQEEKQTESSGDGFMDGSLREVNVQVEHMQFYNLFFSFVGFTYLQNSWK